MRQGETGTKLLEVPFANDNILNREDSISGPTILIVDDMQPVRKIIRRILESECYCVVGDAEDGDEAIILSIKLKPDIVIMDYNMSRVNGIEATRKITAANPRTKIIIMTGYAKPSLVMECMRAGASNFLIKPVQYHSLLNYGVRIMRFSKYLFESKFLSCH